MATFGGNVRRIQKARGMSVTELAGRVGVAQSVVSGWRTDRRGLPETPTLFKLAKALDCSVEELLRDLDEEYSRLRLQSAAEVFSRARWEEKLLERVKCGVQDGLVTLSDVEEVLYPRLTGISNRLEALAVKKHGLNRKDAHIFHIGMSIPDADVLFLGRVVELSVELLERINSRLPDDYDPDPSLTSAQRAELRQEEDAVRRAALFLRDSSKAGLKERSREWLAALESMPPLVRDAVEEILRVLYEKRKRDGESPSIS